MKSEEEIIRLGLKKETAAELYRIIAENEDTLTGDMKKVLHFLEQFVLDQSTILEMEELFE